MGDVKLPCNDANKLVDQMSLIVDACTVKLPQEKRDAWKKCTDLYASTMNKLKSWKVFKFEDVYDFQNTADDFMEVYIFLTGRDGMTNYFHFLHAGHFRITYCK